MGAAPNPVCWHETRARGFGELIPSVFIQHRPRPSGIRHPTSSIAIVLLSTCSVSSAIAVPAKPAVMVPSLPSARGSHSGHIPPSFCPCQGIFFAVSGHRHGAREEGVSASRWDRGKAGTCQPSFHPDPSPEQLHILPGALGKGGER